MIVHQINCHQDFYQHALTYHHLPRLILKPSVRFSKQGIEEWRCRRCNFALLNEIFIKRKEMKGIREATPCNAIPHKQKRRFEIAMNYE
jgi:hypothetical protein